MALLSRKRMCAGVAICLLGAAAAWTDATGCAGGSRDVTVRMCGDLTVPWEVDTLRLIVRDSALAPISDGIIELFECPAEKLIAGFPVERTFTSPGDVDDIEVQGIRKGVVVIKSFAKVDAAEADTAFLGLTQACLGVTCAEGQTCRLGDCIAVPYVTDKGFCGASPPDVGVTGDAGKGPDAGTADGGMDGGFCDNPDAGVW